MFHVEGVSLGKRRGGKKAESQKAMVPGAEFVWECWVWEARLGTLAGNYDL